MQQPPQAQARVAFIDFEASGLSARSWPVEIGWAFETGEPHSLLIRPDESWPLDAWNQEAEALHGISLERLQKEGSDPASVCEKMMAALGDCLVYSDAPDWDEFWMMRLFAAAGRKASIKLHDFSGLMPFMEQDEKEALVEQADRACTRRHRAADDARYLQALYRLASAAT